MKVFVTGSTGFIGAYVVKNLLHLGYEVRCLQRSTSVTDRLSQYSYEAVYGDILDAQSVLLGMKGCDAVLHLASVSNWADMHNKSMEALIVTGTRHVLDAACANGGLPTVYFSSSSAIGSSSVSVLLNENHRFNLSGSDFAYPIAKYQAEELCREFHNKGLRVVIVNPAEVYGPNDTEQITCGSLIDFATNSPAFVCHGGTSIVHADDVALGAIAALENGRSGERYILAGDALTVQELADLTFNLLNLKKKTVSVPNFLVSFLAKAGSFLHLPLPFNPLIIPYAVRYWMMDNTKAKKELGVGFRGAVEVLQPTLEWLKKTNKI